MDRYQRVEKPRPESAINENEIRITTQGLIRNYISYATSLLQEKQVGEIVLKAMGQAISKTVAIAEIIKKRIPGLHQDTTISSTSITDVWEPIEEGLVPLEMTRHVSMIAISLSTRELNKNSPGYQEPLFVEHPRPRKQYWQQQQHPQQPQHQPRQAAAPVGEDTYGRGRVRGRGRGRGWGRGGYGNTQGYRSNQGYDNEQGYQNNQGYDNSQGYRNNQGYNQGYRNNRGYNNQGYRNNQGYDDRGYGNNQENGGYNWNYSRGGGRGGGWGYQAGSGYERSGSGGGGRGYYRGRGRGRMGGGRGRGNQS
ncbi:hypothetical protein QJS10_CPA09g01956 [Acorus calamus]|uniref:DNA/RNA-binding protein Alba-like domain-containing protein n=1 Tax=Acorus calamus TaxID=4465 RepID=A0AAV9E5I3_ACOCL|nr:hypothetical protein QJS10_CPA09g01956 [Acorus calamus]